MNYDKLSQRELAHLIAQTVRQWYFDAGRGKRGEAASAESLEEMLMALVRTKR